MSAPYRAPLAAVVAALLPRGGPSSCTPPRTSAAKHSIKLWLSSVYSILSSSSNFLLAPNWHLVPALGGKLFHLSPVGQHGKNLHFAPAVGREYEVPPIRRPIGILIATRSV